MVNAFDKAMGIVERTSASVGYGPWSPGMGMVNGFLWAAPVDGVDYIAFETSPGQILFGWSRETLKSATKKGAALNIIVEAKALDDEGQPITWSIVGPRGRVKKIFAFLGHSL